MKKRRVTEEPILSEDDTEALEPLLDAWRRKRITTEELFAYFEDWAKGIRSWDPRTYGGSEAQAIAWYIGEHPYSTRHQIADGLDLPQRRTAILIARLLERGEVMRSLEHGLTRYVLRPR